MAVVIDAIFLVVVGSCDSGTCFITSTGLKPCIEDGIFRLATSSIALLCVVPEILLKTATTTFKETTKINQQ